jgi:phosphonatase-like hydrolase
MSTLDLVVFDMAGTTIQDDGQVLSAFIDALAEGGIEVSEQDLSRWRGASKREVVRVFVERQYGPAAAGNVERVENIYATFRNLLETNFAKRGARPVAGAAETFAWLRDSGVKIALTTGFYRKVTDLILDAVAWHQDVIDASVSSDEVSRGRPAPYMIFRAMEATRATDVHRVAKVGDTALDLIAGSNAGALGVVGVLSGSQSLDQLSAATHTHMIPSVAELPSLLIADFGYG